MALLSSHSHMIYGDIFRDVSSRFFAPPTRSHFCLENLFHWKGGIRTITSCKAHNLTFFSFHSTIMCVCMKIEIIYPFDIISWSFTAWLCVQAYSQNKRRTERLSTLGYSQKIIFYCSFLIFWFRIVRLNLLSVLLLVSWEIG